MNKHSRVSPHKVLQSCFNNTVYHLLVENNKREGKWGLRRGLLTFFPWKRGGGGAYQRRGFIWKGEGLNSGLTVAYDIRSRRHGTKFLQRRFYGQLFLTDRYFCSAGSRLLDKEGARSSGPWDGGGGGGSVSKNFFGTSGLSLVKIREGGRAPPLDLPLLLGEALGVVLKCCPRLISCLIQS